MASRFTSDDATGFKLLLCLAVMYGLMSMLVHSIVHMKFVKPLEIDAPLHRFSEARAVEHVRILSQEIDGRQVCRRSHAVNLVSTVKFHFICCFEFTQCGLFNLVTTNASKGRYI